MSEPKFFVVTMTHPDGDGWGEHVMAHVDYLRGLVAADPFAVECLIEVLTVIEWDPLFGVFAEESSFGGAAIPPRERTA